jgi:hypothetical protein
MLQKKWLHKTYQLQMLQYIAAAYSQFFFEFTTLACTKKKEEKDDGAMLYFLTT